MNKKIIIPMALSSIFLALSGCGGEKSSIYEDPNRGVKTSTNGCNNNLSTCQGFVLDYPVSGINFDCSTDKVNHFATLLEGNAVVGGCTKGDTVTFYIQGETSGRKVELGKVDLNKLVPVKSDGQYTQISLADMAQGLTGKEINLNSASDSTYQTMLALVKIFQSVGLQQQSNQLGDVQYIHLSKTLKDDLQKLKADVGANDFSDGSYIDDLKTWLDVSSVPNRQADQIARQLLNLRHVGVFNSEFIPFLALNAGIEGFHGKSLNGGNTAIGSLYMMTTRQGYNLGYALQWRGKPRLEGNQQDSPLARVVLINQVSPTKINLQANNQNWLQPVTNRIVNPLQLKTDSTSSDVMEIYKGRLLSQSVIPSNEIVYKAMAASTETPSSNDYAEWRQEINGERYSGVIDIFKTNPAAYLDREVFRTEKNTKASEHYLFPMYANLSFQHDSIDVPTQTLSVVIEADGEIRTNRSATSLQSDKCLTVNNSLVDNDGIQQYRIGTLAATSNSVSDKSITLRMVLANPIFGNLDGALIGLNNKFKLDSTTEASSGLVRLNMYYLVVDKDISRGINLAGFNNGQDGSARWINMHAVMQNTYNANNANSVTQAQKDLAKRVGGNIQATLAPCYKINYN